MGGLHESVSVVVIRPPLSASRGSSMGTGDIRCIRAILVTAIHRPAVPVWMRDHVIPYPPRTVPAGKVLSQG
jgi:hypothetical protein